MGIGEAGELLRRATVHIRSSHRRRQSTGSGVIWDAAGTVMTNAHVLGNGRHDVETWDGRTYPAEVKSRDDQRDLATLNVAARDLQAAHFRETPVEPGEFVIAVGNPLGFTGALTTGSVRALGPLRGAGRRPWVQASIQLAPGSSGGPLADASGRVIGINTMIVRGGMALAIPASVVRDFIRNGAGPRLGVTIRPVGWGRRRRLGLLVLNVEPGSPAEYASILAGDLLIGADASPFDSPADLADSIVYARAGILKLRFVRGDPAREREVAVSLTGRSSEAA